MPVGLSYIRLSNAKPNADLHARRGEGSELLLHAIRDTREHGRTTGENNVTVKIAPDIQITVSDRVIPEKAVHEETYARRQRYKFT